MTKTKTLHDAKELITNALSSWAIAVDKRLTKKETPEVEVFESSISNTQNRAFKHADELQEQLEASDGLMQTSSLFDLEGNWTPAKIVDGKYGYSWLVLDDNGKSTGIYIPFKSKNRDTQAKRGFVEGIVRVPAQVAMGGGFRPSAKIVPVHEVGTVKPTVIISTDRFNQN